MLILYCINIGEWRNGQTVNLWKLGEGTQGDENYSNNDKLNELKSNGYKSWL